MIKYSKALGRINEEKYNGCFIGRIEFKAYKGFDEADMYETKVKKSNRRLTIFETNGYRENFLVGQLMVYLVMAKIHLEVNSIDNLKNVKECVPLNLQFWRMISKEEVYNFSKQTGDTNRIHLKKEPVVQGLLILEYAKNFIKNFHEIQIKFLNPIYADKKIYISKEDKIILGHSENKLCFKVTYN